LVSAWRAKWLLPLFNFPKEEASAKSSQSTRSPIGRQIWDLAIARKFKNRSSYRTLDIISISAPAYPSLLFVPAVVEKYDGVFFFAYPIEK
jgi:hypothetical protein